MIAKSNSLELINLPLPQLVAEERKRKKENHAITIQNRRKQENKKKQNHLWTPGKTKTLRFVFSRD